MNEQKNKTVNEKQGFQMDMCIVCALQNIIEKEVIMPWELSDLALPTDGKANNQKDYVETAE